MNLSFSFLSFRSIPTDPVCYFYYSIACVSYLFSFKCSIILSKLSNTIAGGVVIAARMMLIYSIFCLSNMRTFLSLAFQQLIQEASTTV